MASLTIRQLDDDIKAKLRIRAAQHGRSMEAEARLILAAAFINETVSSSGIATSIQQIVHQQDMGVIRLEPIDRSKKPSHRQLDFTDKDYG